MVGSHGGPDLCERMFYISESCQSWSRVNQCELMGERQSVEQSIFPTTMGGSDVALGVGTPPERREKRLDRSAWMRGGELVESWYTVRQPVDLVSHDWVTLLQT